MCGCVCILVCKYAYFEFSFDSFDWFLVARARYLNINAECTTNMWMRLSGHWAFSAVAECSSIWVLEGDFICYVSCFTFDIIFWSALNGIQNHSANNCRSLRAKHATWPVAQSHFGMNQSDLQSILAKGFGAKAKYKQGVELSTSG